jgi:hypothetical protein
MQRYYCQHYNFHVHLFSNKWYLHRASYKSSLAETKQQLDADRTQDAVRFDRSVCELMLRPLQLQTNFYSFCMGTKRDRQILKEL